MLLLLRGGVRARKSQAGAPGALAGQPCSEVSASRLSFFFFMSCFVRSSRPQVPQRSAWTLAGWPGIWFHSPACSHCLETEQLMMSLDWDLYDLRRLSRVSRHLRGPICCHGMTSKPRLGVSCFWPRLSLVYRVIQ